MESPPEYFTESILRPFNSTVLPATALGTPKNNSLFELKSSQGVCDKRLNEHNIKSKKNFIGKLI
jgi:hypothetical protein